MTREEAHTLLEVMAIELTGELANSERPVTERTKLLGKQLKAIDMAIEALQTDLVRCKDCKRQEHCYQTVSHTKIHDGFQEHWSETIEWCSMGERKGGDDE